jgi:hypothetical protein
VKREKIQTVEGAEIATSEIATLAFAKKFAM